jgi:hypothetical protein
MNDDKGIQSKYQLNAGLEIVKRDYFNIRASSDGIYL